MVVSLFREISEADRAVGRSRTGRAVRGRASASSGPCAGPVTPPPAGEGARCQGQPQGNARRPVRPTCPAGEAPAGQAGSTGRDRGARASTSPAGTGGARGRYKARGASEAARRATRPGRTCDAAASRGSASATISGRSIGDLKNGQGEPRCGPVSSPEAEGASSTRHYSPPSARVSSRRLSSTASAARAALASSCRHSTAAAVATRTLSNRTRIAGPSRTSLNPRLTRDQLMHPTSGAISSRPSPSGTTLTNL